MPLAEHRSPLRGGRPDTQPEEPQAGGGQDRRPQLQRRLHDHRRQAVGEHMAQDDGPVARPQGSCGLDVRLLADHQRRPPDQPDVHRYRGHRYRHDHIGHTHAQHRDQGERQQESWKGQQQVHPALHEQIHRAPRVAGNHSHGDPCGECQQHRQGSDEKGNPAAVDHARQQVAAQLVGPQRVRRRRGLQDRREINGIGIAHEQRRGQRGGQQHAQDDQAGGGGPPPPQAIPGRSPGGGNRGSDPFIRIGCAGRRRHTAGR